MSASNDDFYALKSRVMNIEENGAGGGTPTTPFTASRDLSGDEESQVVVGIQPYPVSATEPEVFDSFVWTGTEWVLWNNLITTETYGAAGDGVTDDIAAVQAAISAYNSDGRIVFLSRIYLITSQITVSTAGIVITGNGTLKTLSDVTAKQIA